MPDLLAGTTVNALDTPPTVSATEIGTFSFNATTFGIDADSGTYAHCGVAFVAPTTGRVLIHIAGVLVNDTSLTGTLLSFVVRSGGTVGSGGTIEAASDNTCIQTNGLQGQRHGITELVDGLTPGTTYNVRLEHRVTAGVGTIGRRTVTVAPAT